MSYFTAKCTEFDFGWGSAPDPSRGAYSAHPDPLAGFRLVLLEGRGFMLDAGFIIARIGGLQSPSPYTHALSSGVTNQG